MTSPFLGSIALRISKVVWGVHIPLVVSVTTISSMLVSPGVANNKLYEQIEDCILTPDMLESDLGRRGLIKWNSPIRVAIVDITSAPDQLRVQVNQYAVQYLGLNANLDLKVVDPGDLSFDATKRNVVVAFVDKGSSDHQISQLDSFVAQIGADGVTRAEILLSRLFQSNSDLYVENKIKDRLVVSGSIGFIDVSDMTDGLEVAASQVAIATTLLPQVQNSRCYPVSPPLSDTEPPVIAAWFIGLLNIVYDERFHPGTTLLEIKSWFERE